MGNIPFVFRRNVGNTVYKNTAWIETVCGGLATCGEMVMGLTFKKEPFTNCMAPVNVFNRSRKFNTPVFDSTVNLFTSFHWKIISVPNCCHLSSGVPLSAFSRSIPNGAINAGTFVVLLSGLVIKLGGAVLPREFHPLVLAINGAGRVTEKLSSSKMPLTKTVPAAMGV